MLTPSNQIPLTSLLDDIRQCSLCESDLPLGPNPVIRASETAQIMIIGQAPGTKVHESGIPWDDASGKRLRQWLNIDPDIFYDESRIAIMPMGLCYPGKGKSGDLPPRPECAPQWHDQVWHHLPDIKLTLLIGQYAQKYYLQDDYKTLTERVRNWKSCRQGFIPLPHPSPRNQIWLRKNPWFEEDLVPYIASQVHALIF